MFCPDVTLLRLTGRRVLKNQSICFSAHTKDIGIAATVTGSESKLAWVTLTSSVARGASAENIQLLIGNRLAAKMQTVIWQTLYAGLDQRRSDEKAQGHSQHFVMLRERERERDRTWKTLFYNDCSLGSVKTCQTTSPCYASNG